jgi:hypothetical protein
MRSYSQSIVAAIVVFSLAGCATANQTPAPSPRVIATGSDGSLRTYDGPRSDQAIIEAPPAAVLAALNLAYADLGIEVKHLNPQAGEVGNKNFTKMYRLGGKPLSEYVGCGITTTGQAADNYRVTMSLVSHVTPAGTVSRVVTQLTAYAEDLASSKGTMSCLSLGTLEGRLHDLAVRHLSG